MNRKRLSIIVILIFILSVTAVKLKTGYLVDPGLYYCQRAALEYVSLIPEGLILSEVREQEYKGSSYAQFFFEISPEADDIQMENALYNAWVILKKHIKEEGVLAQKNIDIVIFNYDYLYGAGIRNFDLDGNYRKDKWMIYNAEFDKWTDITKYTGLEGLVGCKFRSLSEIDRIKERLDDLKYLYIKVGKDEEEKAENERIIKELLPNVDVDFFRYQRIHTVYIIGKR